MKKNSDVLLKSDARADQNQVIFYLYQRILPFAPIILTHAHGLISTINSYFTLARALT